MVSSGRELKIGYHKNAPVLERSKGNDCKSFDESPRGFESHPVLATQINTIMSKKKYIIVKADANDADYVTEMKAITDEQLQRIMPVIDLLKSKKKKDRWVHNWEIGEFRYGSPYDMYVKTGLLTKEQVNLFDEFVPRGEEGVHTIESVKVVTVIDEVNLF